MKGWIKYLLMLGTALAILIPIAQYFMPNAIPVEMAMLAIVIIGIVGSLITKMKWSVSLGIAVLFIVTVVGIVFPMIPEIGSLLENVFKNVAIFAGSMLIVPALRELLRKGEVKI